MSRCFISVDVSNEVKKEIKRIQNMLPDFVGKKTEIDNLHLTLKFLGEIEEEKIEEVKAKLKKVKLNQFDSMLGEIGVFSENVIRIVWLHLSNCERLQKEVDIVLSGLFEKERRFMSHLTIARVKRVSNKKRFLEDLSRIKLDKIKFKIKKFEFKKSTLTSKGPIYETLEEYKLI